MKTYSLLEKYPKHETLGFAFAIYKTIGDKMKSEQLKNQMKKLNLNIKSLEYEI